MGMNPERSRLLPVASGEWLMAAGVVLIVVSLAVPGRYAWLDRERTIAARADIFALLEAGRQFYQEYGIWPSSQSGRGADPRYGRSLPNAFVINVLRATSGPGNPAHGVNTRKIALIEIPGRSEGWSGLDAQGNFLDPWGEPYQIVVDTDLDQNCSVEGSIYGRRIGEGMVVWSCGPDRTSDSVDDILPWRD